MPETHTMSHTVRALLGSIMLIPVLSATAAGNDEDEKLAAFFTRHIDEQMKHRPSEATRLGDHRFDDRLDDLSPAARAANDARLRAAAAALPKEIDYAKLSRAGQIDFEILAHEFKKSIWLTENTRPYEQDPRVYNEVISDSVFILLTQSTVPKERALQSAIARIAQIPKVLAAAKESLKDPAKTYAEVAVRQNRGAIAFYESGIFAITGENP